MGSGTLHHMALLVVALMAVKSGLSLFFQLHIHSVAYLSTFIFIPLHTDIMYAK